MDQKEEPATIQRQEEAQMHISGNKPLAQHPNRQSQREGETTTPRPQTASRVNDDDNDGRSEKDEVSSFGSSSLSLDATCSPLSLDGRKGEEIITVQVPGNIHGSTLTLPMELGEEEEEEKEETVSPLSQTDGAVQKPESFIPIPYFAGEKHGIDWSRAPKKNGERQTPVQIGCGLRGENLSLPTTIAYTDPDLMPKTDEEWLALYKQSFDDLPPPADAKDARVAFYQRTELEQSFYKEHTVAMHFRGSYKEPDKYVDTRFHFRFAGPTYAVATRVVDSVPVRDIYGRIEESTRRYEYITLSEEIESRIEKADTSDACSDILNVLTKLRARYKDEGSLTDARIKDLDAWNASCETRLGELKEREERGKEEEGKATTTTTTKKQAKEEEEEEKKDNGKDPAVVRPCHLVATTTLPLGEGGVIPCNVDVACPEPHSVFSQRGQYDRERKQTVTWFDRITDARIHGGLFIINTTSGAGSASVWRDLKVHVTIPCAFDCSEHETVVADNDCVRILHMPSGKEKQDEEYTFAQRVRGEGKRNETLFKVVGCSFSRDYILVLGYRRGRNNTSIIVIHRGKGAATFFETDVAVTSAIVSPTHPGTILIGFLDGTILRCKIPPPATDEKPVMTLYPPKGGLGKDVLATLKEKETQKGDDAVRIIMHPLAHSAGGGTGKKKKKKKKTQNKNGDNALAPAEKMTVQPSSLAAIPGTNQYRNVCLHIGEGASVGRIVERGQRILASSSKGLHLFRLFEEEDTQRRITMMVQHNASFDFRGNLLVVHKTNNSVQLFQLHDCKLEASLHPPSVFDPPPPDMTTENSTIVMHDNVVTLFHGDGTRRVLELKNYKDIVSLSSTDATVPVERIQETRDKSFLADTSATTTTTKKKTKTKKNGGGGGGRRKK